MAEIVLLGAGRNIPRDRFRYGGFNTEIKKRPIVRDRVYRYASDSQSLESTQKNITQNDLNTNLEENSNSTLGNLDFKEIEISSLKPSQLVQPIEIERQKKKFNLNYIFIAASCLLIAFGLYMMVSGMLDNRAIHKVAADITKQAAKDTAAVSASSNSSPSENKPSRNAFSSYSVAPDLPKYIKIPSLRVNARVLQVGVLADGSLATPSSIYDTAWYNGSSKPGQPGASLIDAHVSSWTNTPGVFYGIKNLVAGDNIQIVKGDNSVVNYQVVKSVIYPVESVDMQAAISPVVAGTSGLNLITCTGKVKKINGTYLFDHRIVVFAKQV